MSKLRGSRLESEVEKCRVESNWKRLHELFPLVAAKGSGLELLANFFMGEALLENFIDGFNGAFPKPNNGNKETLKRARKYLNAVFDVNDVKQQIAVETHLLLAKLYYICGQYDDAISSISKAKLEQDDVQYNTLRTLRLVTESYAIKGLCLEAVPPKLSSRFQKSVRDEQVLDCFEKSAELALMYLQEVDKNVMAQSSTPTGSAGGGGGGGGGTNLALTSGTVGSASSVAIAASAGVGSNTSGTTLTVAGSGGQTAPSLSASGRLDQFPLQTQQTRIGGLIETAIQRVPISYIRRRDVDKGVYMYRKALSVVDSKPTGQNLQQVLTRQLAEVLLRGVAGQAYKNPKSEPERSPNNSDDALATIVQSPVKFYINQSSSGSDQLFCPSNKWEEAFLLLSISDSIVNREAVLSRADEHSEIRRNTLLNVKAVQNLLTLVLSTLRQYQLLSDIFDRAMKFAYEDNYIWFQFALSLICQGKYGRAAAVLTECLEITSSDDPFQYMILSKLCIEQLGRYDEGVQYAQTAVKICRGGWLTNRAQLLLGLAYSLKGQAALLYPERKLMMKEALTAFEDATRCDPKDHLAQFFLALQLALNRDLDEAKFRCQKSLEMRGEQPVAVLLLALILTAENHYADALDLVKDALDDHPLHYGLLVLRMKLEMKLQKTDDALDTAKELLLFWRLPINPSSPDRVCSTGLQSSGHENILSFDQKSVGGGGGGGQSLGPGGTIGGGGGGGSTAASTTGVGGGATSGSQSVLMNGSSGIDLTDKESIILSTTGPMTEYGGAVSTISDSFGLSSGGVARNLLLQWRMQANIWLELAELFLDCGRLSDVQLCVEEACVTFPNSHQAIYLKGRVHHLAKRWKEAKSCYLGALGVFPNHIPSLRYLAVVYEAEGNQRMAEKVLRDLVKIDPLDHHTWYALGQVLTKTGEHVDASKCFDMALELEDSSPIMPFSAIPRVVHL